MLNFNLAGAAVLRGLDLEEEEARLKIDLERDKGLREFLASIWGVKFQDDPTSPQKPPSLSGKKQTMTQQDIMRNYANK